MTGHRPLLYIRTSEWIRGKMNSSTQPAKTDLLYLVSAPYSGSTLVSFLLGSHRKIASVGELSGPDPKIKPEAHQCSCGMPTAQCPFWHEIQQRLARKDVAFSILKQDKSWKCANNRYIHYALTRAPGLLFLDGLQGFAATRMWPFKKQIAEFLNTNVAVMQEITAYYGASVFLDTSKDIGRLQLLRRSPAVDVKVLHLVRDGRGQTASRVRRSASMVEAAKSLVRFDTQAQNLKHLVGSSRYLRIRYEDICRDPETHLGRAASFAGLEPLDFPKGFQKPDVHQLGNPMRYDFNGQIKLDERWKTGLDNRQLEIFYRIAGNRNRQFGYSKD